MVAHLWDIVFSFNTFMKSTLQSDKLWYNYSYIQCKYITSYHKIGNTFVQHEDIK